MKINEYIEKAILSEAKKEKYSNDPLINTTDPDNIVMPTPEELKKAKEIAIAQGNAVEEPKKMSNLAKVGGGAAAGIAAGLGALYLAKKLRDKRAAKKAKK